MTQNIEMTTLDLRYESYRLKQSMHESKLLESIRHRGIEEPLEGIDVNGTHVLLNGFKRYRCAQKLGIGIVPYISLSEDEVTGLLSMLNISNTKTLNILEQSKFIDHLKHVHNLSVSDISNHLNKSKSWVSMRLNLNAEMTDSMRDLLFSGTFPVYSYMYTLRQFMRMNNVDKKEVEQFMNAVSGKNLSIREIEQIAHGYFRGPDSFREQIISGHIDLAFQKLSEIPKDSEGCNNFERSLLKDLEMLQKYMQLTIGKTNSSKLKTPSFFAQANLLTAGILSRSPVFFQLMRALHDKSGSEKNDL